MAKKYFNEITSTIQLISSIAVAINPYMDLLFLVFWFLDTETLKQLYDAPEKKRIDYVLTYKTPVNAEDELEVCDESNRLTTALSAVRLVLKNHQCGFSLQDLIIFHNFFSFSF